MKEDIIFAIICLTVILFAFNMVRNEQKYIYTPTKEISCGQGYNFTGEPPTPEIAHFFNEDCRRPHTFNLENKTHYADTDEILVIENETCPESRQYNRTFRRFDTQGRMLIKTDADDTTINYYCTGSMHPTTHCGDVHFIQYVDNETALYVGDIIATNNVYCYKQCDNCVKICGGKRHRLVRYNPDKQCWYTKGDNSDKIDEICVTQEQIKYVVLGTIYGRGFVTADREWYRTLSKEEWGPWNPTVLNYA